MKKTKKLSFDEKIDRVAELVKKQRQLLMDVCNSFETEGCEDCGTIDTDKINEIREFLGWKKLDSSRKE